MIEERPEENAGLDQAPEGASEEARPDTGSPTDVDAEQQDPESDAASRED